MPSFYSFLKKKTFQSLNKTPLEPILTPVAYDFHVVDKATCSVYLFQRIHSLKSISVQLILNMWPCPGLNIYEDYGLHITMLTTHWIQRFTQWKYLNDWFKCQIWFWHLKIHFKKPLTINQISLFPARNWLLRLSFKKEVLILRNEIQRSFNLHTNVCQTLFTLMCNLSC